MPVFKSALRWLQNRLSRVTSSGRYIAEIDGLRFVAIGSVLLFHLRYRLCEGSGDMFINACSENWLTGLIQRGHFGVELFFVISGFILAVPFASHCLAGTPKVSLSKYYLRRLTRLEPPYMFCLIVLFAARAAGLGVKPENSLGHLLAGLVYLHGLVYGADNPINHVTWSLEVEVQFYVLVPLLARLFSISGNVRRRLAMTLLAVIFVVAQVNFIHSETGFVSRSVVNYLQYFLGGFVLADVYVASWRGVVLKSRYWDYLALAAWLSVIGLWSASLDLLARAVFPVAVVLFCASAFRGVIVNRLLRLSWITIVGGMCYSIYLIHVPVQGILQPFVAAASKWLPPMMNLLSQVILLAVGTIVVSACYFAAVERPFMLQDWPRRLGQGMGGFFRRARAAGSAT